MNCLSRIEQLQQDLLDGYDASHAVLNEFDPQVAFLRKSAPIADTCKDRLNDLDDSLEKCVDKFVDVRSQILEERSATIERKSNNVLYVLLPILWLKEILHCVYCIIDNMHISKI